MIKLTSRERRLLIGSIAFLALWAFVELSIKPALSRLQTLARVIPEKQALLQTLTETSDQYLALRDLGRQVRQRVADQPSGFELLPFLDGAVKQFGLSRNLAAMTELAPRPLASGFREIIVSVELKGITLKQLVSFLTHVRSAPAPTALKGLDLRKSPAQPDLLDANLQISGLKLAPAGPNT
jgi:type II secretory pathway component PulM